VGKDIGVYGMKAVIELGPTAGADLVVEGL
jgi:hypothetical protein